MTTPFRLAGDYVVCADDNNTVIPNGAIDVAETGRISAVGAVDSLPDAPAQVHNVGGLLMPGLVNSHCHTPMTLVRSAGDGLPLQTWLSDGVWPREMQMTSDDARWGMTLGSAEMLLGGTTTTSEMYLHGEAIIDAVTESGARLVMAPGVFSGHAVDGSLAGRLDEITEIHRNHHSPDARISVAFGPHSLYDLSGGLVEELVARAKELDMLIHIHLEETQTERQQVLDAHDGKSATEVLAEVGALECKVLAAHGVWLSESDQRLLADAGAAVAHCPTSNLKLGSGIAPLADFLERGVGVGIGTDGPASNDDLDMWEEMRLAALLARGTNLDPSAVDAATALRLATSGSAKSIGLDDVGMIAPDYWADIIRVDLDQPAFTPGLREDLLAHLVFAGSPRFVTDVWVAGNQVVKAGECTTIDVEATVAKGKQIGKRLVS